MKNPLVSVIIPNYNHSRYLRERIDSVLAQTYQNFELIILDDCSTDDSRAVIETYRDNPHVRKIVFNEVNAGNTFEQWEKGFCLAEGELCWIAESDDSCHPDLLRKLVGLYESEEDFAYVMCRSFLMDENGRFLGDFILPEKNIVLSGKDFIHKYMVLGSYVWNAGMVLFSREKALGINRRFKQFKGAGDYVFWLDLAKQGKVGIVNEGLNYFRRYSGTVTSRSELDGSNFKAKKRILEELVAEGYASEKQKMLCYAMNLDLVHLYKEMDEEVRKEMLNLWYMSDSEFQKWNRSLRRLRNGIRLRYLLHPLYTVRLLWCLKVMRLSRHDTIIRLYQLQ